MKRVLYVPMIHDPWSPSANTYFADFVRTDPNYPGLDELKASLENHWKKVNNVLDAESIDRVYQDCFTSIHDANEYMSFLSTDDEWNWDAINRLLWKGALLTVTEDPREVRMCSGTEESVKNRDYGIASNIANSMQTSKTAALFMGSAHNFDIYRNYLADSHPPIGVEMVEGNIKELSEIRDKIVNEIRPMFSD